MDATIRRAGIKDAEALGLAGIAAYAETYARLWDDPAAYLTQLATFGREAFQAALTTDATKFWLAEIDGRTIGFLSLTEGVPDPVERAPRGAELGRIYLIRPCHGLGIGRQLAEAAIGSLKTSDVRYVWLDAMKSETRAWKTYQRWGFRQIGEKSFGHPVRPGEQKMLVLRRDLF